MCVVPLIQLILEMHVLTILAMAFWTLEFCYGPTEHALCQRLCLGILLVAHNM